MTDLDNSLARRTDIKGAGLGLIAATVAGAQPAQADNGDASEIWSGEYWA